MLPVALLNSSVPVPASVRAKPSPASLTWPLTFSELDPLTVHVCDAPKITGALIVSLPLLTVIPLPAVLPLLEPASMVSASAVLELETVMPLLVPVPVPKFRLLTARDALRLGVVLVLRFALKKTLVVLVGAWLLAEFPLAAAS